MTAVALERGFFARPALTVARALVAHSPTVHRGYANAGCSSPA